MLQRSVGLRVTCKVTQEKMQEETITEASLWGEPSVVKRVKI